MPFEEKPLFSFTDIVYEDTKTAVPIARFGNDGEEFGTEFGLLALIKRAFKWLITKVTGQSDAAGDNHAAMFTLPCKPRRCLGEEVIEAAHGS